MALALYMDHHVPRAIALGLRLRAVDVITAHEDGASQMSDPDLFYGIDGSQVDVDGTRRRNRSNWKRPLRR